MSIAESTQKELDRIAKSKLVVEAEADTKGNAGVGVTLQRELPKKWTVAWFAEWWKGKGGKTGARVEKGF
jgi:hypothetical protein